MRSFSSLALNANLVNQYKYYLYNCSVVMNMLENTSHVVAEVFKSLDDVWNMVQLYF